jgi:transcriptional regulator with XRE-family HTH domain
MPIREIHLTDGERLLLYRRRRGWTQLEAAKSYGVGVTLYKSWETAEVRYKPPPRAQLNHVRAREVCFILRRRLGITQKELAARMGICRYWLYSMEQGDVSAKQLIEYWAKVGVPKP